eukprot:m.31825 g.31825  ORF g.31825 m.31825 type:complete len:86 (+) comp6976_c0_seq2:1278-1535(+)
MAVECQFQASSGSGSCLDAETPCAAQDKCVAFPSISMRSEITSGQCGRNVIQCGGRKSEVGVTPNNNNTTQHLVQTLSRWRQEGC